MLKFVQVKKTTILFLLVVLMKGNCYSQAVNKQAITKEVYKQYRQADSTAVNSAGVLVFYKDNTFINYGILKDLKNFEAYVWYTYGTWALKNNEMVCKTYFETFNQKKIIDEIKTNYKTRPDYRLIDSYYEFTFDRYMDYPFVIMKGKVFDNAKKIEYVDKDDVTKKD